MRHVPACKPSNKRTYCPYLTYRALGDVYGLPKMHYKGKQGDFYIMVSFTELPSVLDMVFAYLSYLTSLYVVH